MLGPQGGSSRPSRPASPHRSVCLPGEGRAAGPKAKSRHRAQGLRLTSTALPTSRRLRRLDASEAASPLSGKKSSVASNKLSADWLNAMGPRGDVLAPPHGGMRSRPCSPGACVFPLCAPPHTRPETRWAGQCSVKPHFSGSFWVPKPHHFHHLSRRLRIQRCREVVTLCKSPDF